MAEHLIVLAVFLSMILGVIGADNSSYTTESLALKYGYPIESHKVTTNDGYILTVHHIPKPNAKKVVFMMHGMLCSSSDFLIGGSDNALAFLLSDADYDVWLGNARGNTYSRNHSSLDPNSAKFWDFDWHEIGLIDLPAMISYVREQTGVEKLVYIGHSQGTTSFLVLNSIFPDFNKYFESVHLLSPVVFMSHLAAPLFKYAAPFAGHPTMIMPFDILGNYEFKLDPKVMSIAAKIMCKKNIKNYQLCKNLLFLGAEFDDNTVADGLVEGVMATTPAGASTKQFLHYLQEYSSGKFRQFDYGMARNLIKYQQTKPPNYPLANVHLPIYIYYSDNDSLAAVEDVEILISELPATTVKMALRIPDPTFDHLSQLYNIRAKELVYKPLLSNILDY